MIDYLKKFERFVTGALILLLSVVIVLSLVELVWILTKDVLNHPVFILEVEELLELFGIFLLVLVGLELLETIKCFYVEGRIDLKVVFTVALIALGRKIIILEPERFDGLTLIGVGVIILSLVAGYFVVTTRGLEFQKSLKKTKTSEA
jgi:uncharacterized membrane protein (DUF373 family)